MIKETTDNVLSNFNVIAACVDAFAKTFVVEDGKLKQNEKGEAIPMPRFKSLAERMHDITHELSYVKKGGKVNYGKTNYNYLTELQINENLKPLLFKHRVGFRYLGVVNPAQPIILSGKENDIHTILCKFEFVNIDVPEDKFECFSPGQGKNAQDKGVYIAVTGSRKYCLMQNFLISTGDDPEKDTWNKASKPESGSVKKETDKFLKEVK